MAVVNVISANIGHGNGCDNSSLGRNREMTGNSANRKKRDKTGNSMANRDFYYFFSHQSVWVGMNCFDDLDDKNLCKRIFLVHHAILCVRCTDQNDSSVAE